MTSQDSTPKNNSHWNGAYQCTAFVLMDVEKVKELILQVCLMD
jgi:hypothetical protein